MQLVLYTYVEGSKESTTIGIKEESSNNHDTPNDPMMKSALV